MDNKLNNLLGQVDEINALLKKLQQEHEASMNLLGARLGDIKSSIQSLLQESSSSTPAAIDSTKAMAENVAASPAIEQPAVTTPAPKPEPQQAPAQEHLSKPNIMEAFSINDRFLFLRELFGGDEQLFTDTIAHLQGMRNFNQASAYMTDVLEWNPSNDIVKDFMRLVEMSFK